MSKLFSSAILTSLVLCVFLPSACSKQDCRPADVEIFQSPLGFGSDHVPLFMVQIVNASPKGRRLFDVHVACGNFASTKLVNPRKFKRIRPGVCLVKNGSHIEPNEIIAFKYSNLFSYKLTPSSVRC